MDPVLDLLDVADRHEAHADRGVHVGAEDDPFLALGQPRPAERLRPEPGQAGQVMSVHDNVVQRDGHADSMRRAGAPRCVLTTRPGCAGAFNRGSISLNSRERLSIRGYAWIGGSCFASVGPAASPRLPKRRVGGPGRGVLVSSGLSGTQ